MSLTVQRRQRDAALLNQLVVDAVRRVETGVDAIALAQFSISLALAAASAATAVPVWGAAQLAAERLRARVEGGNVVHK